MPCPCKGFTGFHSTACTPSLCRHPVGIPKLQTAGARVPGCHSLNLQHAMRGTPRSAFLSVVHGACTDLLPQHHPWYGGPVSWHHRHEGVSRRLVLRGWHLVSEVPCNRRQEAVTVIREHLHAPLPPCAFCHARRPALSRRCCRPTRTCSKCPLASAANGRHSAVAAEDAR